MTEVRDTKSGSRWIWLVLVAIVFAIAIYFLAGLNERQDPGPAEIAAPAEQTG